MSTVQDIDQIQVGEIYKFSYNGKARVALVLEDWDKQFHCWDFTSDNYRTFATNQLANAVIEKVTDKAVVTVNPRPANENVHGFHWNGNNYYVRF